MSAETHAPREDTEYRVSTLKLYFDQIRWRHVGREQGRPRRVPIGLLLAVEDELRA